MLKILMLLSALLTADLLNAQSVDINTALRQDGKIYVVVTVLVIILTGLFIYMIRTDKKISRIEKHEN